MTDYYPVIARRIAGLKDNTAESRRALYQRLQNVLVEQLRELDPPLEEPEILRERLSLEDAVRRVEADAERPIVDRPSEERPAPRRFSRTRVAAFDGAFVATGIEAPRLVPGSEDDPRGPEARRSAPPAENAYRRRGRLAHRLALMTAWFVVLASVALAVTLYWHRDQLKAWFGISPLAGWQQREIIPPPPKIADRVSPGQQAPQAATAQSASLYEEDPADQRGRRYAGSVSWKTETVSPEGKPRELAIRAELEIPERHMRMMLSLRRNPDKVLPASHTIEITFPSPTTFGEITGIPALLMKSGEQADGSRLAGVTVKVTSGLFLIGLSAADGEMQRNLQMLKEQPWFDIPLVYENGRRAILAIEKGAAGERAFQEAFAAWGE
jgi:hypothetical protein